MKIIESRIATKRDSIRLKNRIYTHIEKAIVEYR